MNCEKCGRELKPAPAKWDGESTFVGFLPCICKTITIEEKTAEIKRIHQKALELNCSDQTAKYILNLKETIEDLKEQFENHAHYSDNSGIYQNY